MQKYMLQTILILCIGLSPIGQGFSAEKQTMDSMSGPCLEHMNNMELSGKICDSEACFLATCLSLGSGFSFFGSNQLTLVNNLSFDYWNRYLDPLEPAIPSQIYRPPTA